MESGDVRRPPAGAAGNDLPCGCLSGASEHERCYQIKDCPFDTEKPTSTSCPARRLEIGCWQYDWVAHYRGLPRGPASEEWKQAMLDACPGCVVYALHAEALRPQLVALADA